MMDGWWWHGMTRGPGVLVACLMFLFVIAAIALAGWLIVRLLRSTSSKSASAPSAPQSQILQPDPVLETLRQRLAAGAITAQEFDELRQKLGVLHVRLDLALLQPAMFCSLKKPLSSAAAAGVPNAAGKASRVGTTSALSLGWLDKLQATIKKLA